MAFLDNTGLARLWNKITTNFVKKKEGYGLSQNDLTNELVQKINEAGKSNFDGNYNNLTNKPAIDGQDLSSSSTAAGLGLAKTGDLPTAATTEKAGLVIPDGTSVKVDATGKISVPAPDMSDYLTQDDLDDYATETYVGQEIDKAKTSINEGVDSKVSQAKTDMEEHVGTEIGKSETKLMGEIAKQVSSHGTYKGQKDSIDDLPTQDVAIGDEYNMTAEFTTTAAKFTDGGNKKYPAGSNVICSDNTPGAVKWDVTQGFTDFSLFAEKSELPTAISNDVIDALPLGDEE